MAKIYLVSKSGVEWNDPIKAFANKKAATALAQLRNSEKDESDVFDRLSEYVVTEIDFEPAKGE